LAQTRPIQPRLPRGTYAAIMALATLVAIGVAAGVSLLMGAPERVAMLAVIAIAAGSFATFVPAAFNVEKQTWGMVVLAGSMGRMLLILAIMLILERTRDLGDSRTALWIGVLCGAATILVIEAVASIRIIASMDKPRLVEATEPRPAARA
jgi:hypothetical protein